MDVYNHKALLVDLSKNKSSVIRINEEIYKKLVGGKGLGAYLLYKFLKPKVEPHSEKNPLILATGPLNNTRFPLTSKVGFFFKSFVTGGYGESYVGGSLPKYPKALGYDAVIIVGKSKKPSLLLFHEEGVDFEDARELWGLGTIEVDNALRKRFGSKATIVSIGPAGENLVRFASINVDKWRQAGRTGGGAVLGSKRVKALVFIGGETFVEPKNRDLFDEVFNEAIERIRAYKGKDYFRMYGTSAMANIANEMGFFPSYYWSSGVIENWENISSDAVKELLVHPHACWNCPFACGRYIRFVWEGKEYFMDGLEYETIYALGGLIGLTDIQGVAYLNYLADDLGMDVISLGNVLGFAIYAAKSGKIKLNLEYGDVDSLANLIRDIAYRREIGSILAEGVKRASERFGLSEDAVHVKGLEPAGYDPRVLKSMSIAYATSPRGACHLRVMGYIIDIRKLAGSPGVLDRVKVEKIVEFEEWMTAFDSLIICKFARDIYDFDFMVKMFNSVTNFNISASGFRLAMKRIIAITRLINEREGFSRKDDILPKKFFREKLSTKGANFGLSESEFESALNYYYDLRGIDKNTGFLKSETLEKLGLKHLLEGSYLGENTSSI